MLDFATSKMIKGGNMFARITTFQGSPDKEAKALSGPPPAEVQAMRGFKGAYTLENRETGKAMLITLWDSEADMLASAEGAKRPRAETVHESGSMAEPQVEMFEVMSHP